ncbi:hypothetical protein ACFDTO_17385 [Microbacteriaceae bacterium 4G12]
MASTPNGRARDPVRTRAVVIIIVCVALLVGIGLGASPRRSDTGGEPAAAQVDVFTFVATGIVFVDPVTSDIVWKDTRGGMRTVGRDPWRNPERPKPSVLTGSAAWRETREVVGNPDHDLVSWVETTDGERGDLVLVEASTGDVLARTPVPVSAPRAVVIAAVDNEAAYFATPDPATGFPDMPATDLWIWRWATGEAPRHHGGGPYYNDVGGGTWARYGTGGVEFAGEDGRTRATTADTGGTTDFGRALSPNGRYWYDAWTSRIVDTATGEEMIPPAAGTLAYGWTGPAELSLIDPYVVCDAEAGTCDRSAALDVRGVCAPYDVYCRDGLPVN